MKPPPMIETSFVALPRAPEDLHEFLVDIFGRYVSWAVEEALRHSSTLVRSAEARDKLGRIFQEPYSDAASKLTPDQQTVALNLAKVTAESFAKLLLAVLESQGTAQRLGEDHAIRFRLVMEVCNVQNMEVLLDHVINRDGKRAFSDYWGRWASERTKLSKP
jgi:hypothetical protein